MSLNYNSIVKYSSFSTIKTAQAALLFGDLQRAFHAPQPPGPKQKHCTPPVSQFSCSPDWSLREGGLPGKREPVFPVFSQGWGEESRAAERGREVGGGGLVHASCLRTTTKRWDAEVLTKKLSHEC